MTCTSPGQTGSDEEPWAGWPTRTGPAATVTSDARPWSHFRRAALLVVWPGRTGSAGLLIARADVRLVPNRRGKPARAGDRSSSPVSCDTTGGHRSRSLHGVGSAPPLLDVVGSRDHPQRRELRQVCRFRESDGTPPQAAYVVAHPGAPAATDVRPEEPGVRIPAEVAGVAAGGDRSGGLLFSGGRRGRRRRDTDPLESLPGILLPRRAENGSETAFQDVRVPAILPSILTGGGPDSEPRGPIAGTRRSITARRGG